MADWPSIPEFTDDPSTLASPMRVMKMAIEMVTRQRPSPAGVMARVFIQSLDPSKDPAILALKGVVLKQGDLWIDTSATNKLRFWDEAARAWAATT